MAEGISVSGETPRSREVGFPLDLGARRIPIEGKAGEKLGSDASEVSIGSSALLEIPTVFSFEEETRRSTIAHKLRSLGMQ